MPIDQGQIGKRLNAYRVGSGLSPEELAARLGISRTALYNYEREGVGRLDVLERVAEVLGVSVATLIGVDTEHFPTASGFFERMRQLEEEADQIVATFEPISFLLTSPEFPERLSVMLREALTDDPPGLLATEQVLSFLAERRAQRHRVRRQSVTSIVAAPQLARLLRTGLIGRDDLPATVRAERRRWARDEVARIAELLAAPPIGVQVGIVEATPYGQTFQLVHLRDRSLVAVSPFRLADQPNVTIGIASITAEPETVRLYDRLAQTLWARALTGSAAARRVERLITESECD
jgi:transcriptional regulator with XRE-family HTH domain